MYIYKEAVGLL